MKKLNGLVIVIFLLSSCTSATTPVSVTPTAENIIEYTKTPVPTPTETQPPTFTPTPALPPISVECAVDNNITDEICPFVEEAVIVGRSTLIKYFGRDIVSPVKFHFSNDPAHAIENTDNPHMDGGAFMDKNQVVQINIANKIWRDFGAEDAIYRRELTILHEMTHLWQTQNKCDLAQSEKDAWFMAEGQAQYTALFGSGHTELFNPAQAAIMWSHMGFVERDWIDSADVSQLAFKYLMETRASTDYTKFCGRMAEGASVRDAFQEAFGIGLQDFRREFMEKSLGTLKDCTQATCGDAQYGKITVDPVYGTLTDYIDRSLAEPNLVVHFTDENGKPAENTILTLCKLTEDNSYACSGGEDRPIDAAGDFIRPLEVGTYRLEMCTPGYAENSGNPIKCVYETKPFDITAGKGTTIDFQFHAILSPDQSAPNLAFTLTDVKGAPVPNQYIQICADEPGAYICLNTKTDAAGQYKAALREGTYVMRFVRPGQGSMDPRGVSNPDKYGMHLNRHYYKSAEYEIQDIQITYGKMTTAAFQYPDPNFKIYFKDAYGGAILPNLVFWMCKTDSLLIGNAAGEFTVQKDQSIDPLSNREIGDCSYEFGADKTATFQANLEPGVYLIFFNVTRPRWTQPFEYELAGVNITSETGLTEITFQP